MFELVAESPEPSVTVETATPLTKAVNDVPFRTIATCVHSFTRAGTPVSVHERLTVSELTTYWKVPLRIAMTASPSRPAMKQKFVEHVVLEGRVHASTVNVVRDANVEAPDDPAWFVPLRLSALSAVLIVLSGPLPPA